MTAKQIVTLASAAEAAGVDDLWVSDHVLARRGSVRPPEQFHDALTVLTWAAAHTSRIGLGTSVLVAPYRHPVTLARATATLDALSGGRLILGIGSGWQRREFAALGIPFAERGARTDEAIAVCRALWSGAADFAGRFTSYTEMTLRPGPARPGGPPIWIGGVSAAAARRAARLGDAWHLTLDDAAALAEQLDGLARELDAVDRAREDVSISVRVRRDPDDIARLVPDLRALGVDHVLADLSRSAADDLPEQIEMLRAHTR